ncbi:MAG TPA: NADH-quinone oxidoreductase subunit J, partial [Nocardioides sp.]|nr:NADH-quinone oxidoreductase subunit J [Nocardioides sp.]
VDTPALLPDGSPAPASVSRVLAARGTMQSRGLTDIEAIKAQLGVDPEHKPETAGKSAATGSSEENEA